MAESKVMQDKMARPGNINMPVKPISWGNSGSVRLKVTPVELKRKADEVTQEIQRMTTAFQEMERIIARTSYYWIGEAGNRHRQMYEEDKKEIEIMLRRLREHPSDLLRMANVYEDAEAKVREMSEMLPGDIIS